jgi:DNA-binding IclR family transcriptional regulator
MVPHRERRNDAYPGTQAVRRAVGLVKALGRGSEMSLAELCGDLGLSKPTAYRLLTALAAEGFVERAATGEYRIGPELVAIGRRRSGDLRLVAGPVLGALAEETRETATVEVLAGADVVILEETMGRHVVGSLPSIGTRWPAHATSTGKVLLAHLGEAQLLELLRRPLGRFTPRTITSPMALRRELGRVRQRGWAVSQEELEPGFVAVAAPVRGGDSRVAAAVSVGGPRTRMTAERVAAVAARVVEAAARLSALLGHRQEAGEPSLNVRRVRA